MIEIIKELNIEVSKPNVFQAVVAKQYDMNTRFIKATFVDGKEKITIDPTATVKVVINALRPDGESKGFEGEVNKDGTVTVPLHSWMLELDGTVLCDISVIDIETDDNKKLTTTSFTLYVEKAAFGGEDITSDPQFDVLVALMDAATVAQEALDKSNEANAKYDACVKATEDAEAVVTEWQNEIDRTNSRIDELVEMRGINAVSEYEIDGYYVRGTIKTNGVSAEITFPISIRDLEGDAQNRFTDYCIPAEFMPMNKVTLVDTTNSNELKAFIDPADVNAQGMGRVAFAITGAESSIPDTLYYDTCYGLAVISVPEVADIRVGYNGTKYDTAGEALRSQIKDLVQRDNTFDEDISELYNKTYDHENRIVSLEEGGSGGGGAIYLSKDEANYQLLKGYIDAGKTVVIDDDSRIFHLQSADDSNIRFHTLVDTDGYVYILDYSPNNEPYEGDFATLTMDGVNQQYDPLDKMPISGQGVAKALETVGGGEQPLKLIKTITLEEAVQVISVTFDKPLKEIYMVYTGGLNTDTDVKDCVLAAACNNYAHYFAYRAELSFLAGKKTVYIVHAKEMVERRWESTFAGNTLYASDAGALQGISAQSATAQISYSTRTQNGLPRYVSDLKFLVFRDNTYKFSAGSTLEIYGVEVDE